MTAQSALQAALDSCSVPEIDLPIGKVGTIETETDDNGVVRVAITLRFPATGLHEAIVAAVEDCARAVEGVAEVDVSIDTAIVAHGVQPTLKPLPGVSNILAVASGKGGVGKSTTAVNLALALAADGARVGILDADIYGPSQPLMLGLQGQRPLSEDGQSMLPLEAHRLKVMSVGFLVDADQPMVWRGPMVTQALNQLLTQTRWGDIDYLVVDMPPGTGDIQLTLSQRVPVSGAVIVTTPQDIALADAIKGLQMFRKVSIPVLGVIENMSTHVCSQCGHEEALFGSGGGQRMAESHEVPLLGQLPLDIRIREQTDGGRPTVVAEPDGPVTAAYRRTARRMTARLAARARDFSSKFPNIVVENS